MFSFSLAAKEILKTQRRFNMCVLYLKHLLQAVKVTLCDKPCMDWKGGVRDPHRVGEMRVQAYKSLHQLHLCHSSRWPHLLPHRDNHGHQTQSFPTSSHRNNMQTAFALLNSPTALQPVHLCRHSACSPCRLRFPRSPLSLHFLPPPCHG